MNHEQLLEIETLRHALAVNMLYGDRGDLKGYLRGFTDDAELTMRGETHEGREGIKNFLLQRARQNARDPEAVASRRNLKHHITTTQIDLAATDKADLDYYFIITAGGGIPSTGHCEDQMVKVGPRWLVARRLVNFDDE